MSQQQAETKERIACYVYGIVPADVEVSEDTRGVGDPPAPVDLVRHGEIAALVSDISLDKPLGRPADLTAHENLLDATVLEVPVLPLRFGAVVSDRDAVSQELLAEHHDEFAGALNDMQGQAQYVLHGRYEAPAVLTEVLSENRQAARLRDDIRGRPEAETRDLRIALGEIINSAIEAKRQHDTQVVLERIEPYCRATKVREPTHEDDAAHVAFLCELGRQREVEGALEKLAADWRGRVTMRLLGPMAPYDFVATSQPSAG